MGLPDAAGARGREPVRHFRAAMAQAAKAHIPPRLPAQPASTKAMAPTGMTDDQATRGPSASASPLPIAAGRADARTARQGAAAWQATPDDSTAGAASGERQGPAQGDVYLDGRLMGRWMAQALAAEAGRPASGSAGFDPRRNVFPTGAMIGG
jgi:hypothetical protein